MAAAAESDPNRIRHWIDANPDAEYPAVKDRYHLYVSYACPFAHRALAARNLSGLQDLIGLSVVHPVYQRTRPNDPNDEHLGWTFVDPAETPTLVGPNDHKNYSSAGAVPDPVNHAHFVRDLYAGYPDVTRFTVPVLWDKQTKTIVSNETADIVVMLNQAFRALAPNAVVIFPEDLKEETQEAIDWVQNNLFSHVFKAAFAKTLEGYEEAITGALPHLQHADDVLAKQRFFVGNGERFTEADLRLFVGLLHFDVYSAEFRAHHPADAIPEFPNLTNFLRDVYQNPAVTPTVHQDHIKLHGDSARPSLYPDAKPVGIFDRQLYAPHDRTRFPVSTWY